MLITSFVLFHSITYYSVLYWIHHAASAVWTTLQSNYRFPSLQSVFWKLQHFVVLIIRGCWCVCLYKCTQFPCQSGLLLKLMLSVRVTGITFLLILYSSKQFVHLPFFCFNFSFFFEGLVLTFFFKTCFYSPL